MKPLTCHEKDMTHVKQVGFDGRDLGTIGHYKYAEVPGKLLAIRPYSSNPKDAYLSVVLYVIETHPGRGVGNSPREYVTSLYNWEAGGCGNGHYHESPTAALNDFCNRKL